MSTTRTRRETLALLNQLDARERADRRRRFLAPRVAGGRVRTRLAGVVQSLRVSPADFVGWGVFAVTGASAATLVSEAEPTQVARYLELFPAVRVLLVRPLRGSTWLAYPASEADFSQRFGPPRPLPVHLTDGVEAFDTAVVRAIGGGFWFDTPDRRAAIERAEALRLAQRDEVGSATLRIAGLTPEERTAYALATESDREAVRSRDERRLRGALELGGGSLEAFSERDDYWIVHWRTGSGETHTSAIARSDLTVLSSGICLSERDSDFDLTSLVGVVERRQEEWE